MFVPLVSFCQVTGSSSSYGVRRSSLIDGNFGDSFWFLDSSILWKQGTQEARITCDSVDEKPLAALATESAEQPRLAPPDCLGAREVVEWRAIVVRFGADMFPRETHALLASMCGAIVNLNDINLELSTLPPGIPGDLSGWNKFRNLIRLRGQLATQVAMVGTKLRIMPTSRDVRRLRTTEYERRLEEDEIKPWHDA